MPHPETIEDVAQARAWIASGAGRQIRLAAHLSLEDVAGELGVARSSVLRWEAGDVRPGAAHAIAYAALLRRLLLMGGES